MPHYVNCPKCDGWGVIAVPPLQAHSPAQTPCPTCDGAGGVPLAPLDYARTSRAAAYEAHEEASRAYRAEVRRGVAHPDNLALMRAESEALYAEYRRWVKADSLAAQAGALD